MNGIWYLLKCPKGAETEYAQACQNLAAREEGILQEVLCFQYQRMMRYGGGWHLERRTLLPGCIFLSGTGAVMDRYSRGEWCKGRSMSIIPCRRPYMKEICPQNEVIAMSKGIIRNGRVIVTDGPLEGRERLIVKVDRHKRTAQVEFPFETGNMKAVVGLEIYQKEIELNMKREKNNDE